MASQAPVDRRHAGRARRHPDRRAVCRTARPRRLDVPEQLAHLVAHHLAGLANYRALLADSGARHAFAFTAIFTAVIVPLVFAVGLALAALLENSRRGISLVRAAVIAPVTIGFATASYLWLSLLDPSTGIFDRISSTSIWSATQSTG